MAKRVMRDKERDDLMVGIHTGLLTGEHYSRMGRALWLFAGLLTLTRMDEDDGDIPYSREEIMRIATKDWGLPKVTFYRFFNRLLEEGYIQEDGERGGFNIVNFKNFYTFFQRKKEERWRRGKCQNGGLRYQNGSGSHQNGTGSIQNGTDLGSELPQEMKSITDEEEQPSFSFSLSERERVLKEFDVAKSWSGKIARSRSLPWIELAATQDVPENVKPGGYIVNRFKDVWYPDLEEEHESLLGPEEAAAIYPRMRAKVRAMSEERKSILRLAVLACANWYGCGRERLDSWKLTTPRAPLVYWEREYLDGHKEWACWVMHSYLKARGTLADLLEDCRGNDG